MLNSKTNRTILIISAFVLIALVLFAALRDDADKITLGNAQKILNNGIVKDVTVIK